MGIELREGEIYIGRINDEHIILLPGDMGYDTWRKASDWAKSLGGDLPNRIEQAMLFAHFKDQFKPDWYWSNTTVDGYDAHAWCQNFTGGGQYITRNDDSYCRARAVRRLMIGKEGE